MSSSPCRRLALRAQPASALVDRRDETVRKETAWKRRQHDQVASRARSGRAARLAPHRTRHGWAKPSPDGTVRAIIGETDAGYTAELVDAGDAEGPDRSEEHSVRWGPQAFDSPLDAIDAAEAHLTADDTSLC